MTAPGIDLHPGRTVAIFGRDTSTSLVPANGRHIVLVSRGGAPLAAAWIEAAPEGINQVYVVANPAKLARLAPA
ncbi:hypothetical protein ACWEOE_32550 [Amycolatopsis sp. NPDC004368]